MHQIHRLTMLSSTHIRSSFSDSSGYDDKGEERKLNELENDDDEEVPNYGTSKEKYMESFAEML